MKKLLFLLLLIPFFTFGQAVVQQSKTPATGSNAGNSYFQWYSGAFTGYVIFPIGTNAVLNRSVGVEGQLYLQTSDTTIQVFHNGHFIPFGGGGSSSTTYFSSIFFSGAGTFASPLVIIPNSVFPSQTGEAGNFLTTDGTNINFSTYVPENVANKATDFSTVNNTVYPTTQAVVNYITTGGGVTANNGLTKTGNNIALGGALTGNTTISSGTNFFLVQGTSAKLEVFNNTAFMTINNSGANQNAGFVSAYDSNNRPYASLTATTATNTPIQILTTKNAAYGNLGFVFKDNIDNAGAFYSADYSAVGAAFPLWIPHLGYIAANFASLSASNTFTGGFTSQYNGGSTYPFTSINNVGVTNTTASGVGVTMQSNTISWLTGGFVGSLTMTPTANRTITLPDASGTVALTSGIPTAANPTATAGATAVNGSATTYMRSDGAPKVDSTVFQTVLNFFPKGDTRWLKSSSATSTYVPYTGASGNVTLGTHTITSGGNIINLSAGTQTTQFTDWQTAIGANAANLNSEMYIYGTGHSVDESYGAGGTLGSLTALPALQELRAFAASGYDGSAYNAGGQVSLQFFTKNAWTTSSHSTYALIKTTPIGSLTETPGLLIDNDQSLYAAGPYFVTGDATQSHPNNFGYTNSVVQTIYNSSTNAAAASRMELVGGSLNTGASGSFFTIDGYSLYNSASPRSIQLSGTLVGSGTANHYASTFSVAVSPDNGSLTKVATFGTGTSGIIFPAYTTAGILHNTVTTGVITSSPVSLTADISGILPIANGGTGIATAPALGSIPYGSTSTALAYVAPNTTTTQKFLTETGTGTVGAIPVMFDLFGTANTWLATNNTQTLLPRTNNTYNLGSGTFLYANAYLSNINTSYVNNFNNGNETLDGTSSGIITLQTQANSGTYNWNWPTTAGTAGQVLTSQAGGSTAQTWSSVPLMQATADLTAQSAAGNVTTFTVGASTATFNLSGYINITAVTSDVVELQATYTDENNTSQTANFFTQGATSALLSSIGNSAYPPMVIRAKNATVITIKTILTTSIGSIAYDVGGRIQQL